MSKKNEVGTKNQQVEINVNEDNSVVTGFTNDFRSILDSSLAIDTEKLMVKVGDNDVIMKDYQLVNPSTKRSSITIYDASIIESTEKIKASLTGRKILNYVIGKELQHIADSGKLEKLGFKTVAEFGKAMFDLETSTVNHYVNVSRLFITDDYKVKTGLPSLSYSHFIELIPLVGEDGDITPVINAYINGDVVDGMTTKALRTSVKTLTQGITQKDDTTDSTEEESPIQVEKTDKVEKPSENINDIEDIVKLANIAFNSTTTLRKVIEVIELKFPARVTEELEKLIHLTEDIDSIIAMSLVD